MCDPCVNVLCYKMWSRNFIPDYGIKLVLLAVLLSTLKIDGAEGKVFESRAYESAVGKATAGKSRRAASSFACAPIVTHRSVYLSSHTRRLVKLAFLKLELVNASHFYNVL